MTKSNSTISELLSECCFKWEKTSVDAFEGVGTFRFEDNFAGFDGHFPDQPILPAIMQLGAVRILAEKITESKLVLSAYANTKFKGMLQPAEDVEVTVKLKVEEIQLHADFVLNKKSEGVVSSGSCVFTRIDER